MSDINSGTLDMLKETFKPKGVLLPQIERHVLKSRSGPSDRKSTIMHPSEIIKTDWCGRHDFYRMTGVPTSSNVKANSFQLESVFDFGHETHKRYQTWLWEMGILWGTWECLECKHRWQATSPDICPRCGFDRLKYREVPLENELLLIEGHADGLVVLEEAFHEKALLIEIKTIGLGTIRMEVPGKYEQWMDQSLTPDEIWYRIKRPFPGHIRQGMVYLYLLRHMGFWPDLNEIVYIYMSKMTGATKEFVVQYNEGFISDILEQAAVVAAAVKGLRDIPSRPSWTEEFGSKSKGCKTCEYRNGCWGEEDAAEVAQEQAVRVRKARRGVRRKALGS